MHMHICIYVCMYVCMYINQSRYTCLITPTPLKLVLESPKHCRLRCLNGVEVDSQP